MSNSAEGIKKPGDGKKRDQFSSKFGFILAAAGSAVGLGNLWRFPYQVGSNGGGAFVLIYLICIIFIGGSIMLAEMAIGRSGKSNAVESYAKISKKFAAVGYWAIAATFALFAFYAIIGGWTIFYVVQTITGRLIGLPPDQLGATFGGLLGSPYQMLLYQVIFLIMTGYVVSKGISGGIEKYCRVLMPALFIMMIILAVRAVTLPGAMEGVIWYLKPDFSQITGSTIVSAVGQAFFSLSLGAGGMITYASYLRDDENLGTTAVSVTIADTSVALLAGLIIMPAVFAFGLEPGEGAGLAFITLPHVFGQLPMGVVFATVFFLLLLVAALTSSIAMLETITTLVVEKSGMNRNKTSWLAVLIVFILGIPPLMSFGAWSHITFAGKNLFDIYDYFVSNITLPTVGLLTAILVGYIWKKEDVMVEVTGHGKFTGKIYDVWYFIIKFVAPVVLTLIALTSLGIIKI
jgi:NSS family neurotransmitter:Na+ symporter